MRKLLSPLMVLMLVCVAFFPASAEQPAEARASEKHLCGDFAYIILDDGTAEIIKYTGQAEKLTIPDELDQLTVTGIGDWAFAICHSLTAVSIPDSVTSIWGMAFSVCDSLTTVTLPASVTRIEPNAFWQKENRSPVFIVPKGSYAEQFCKENGYRSLYPEEQD